MDDSTFLYSGEDLVTEVMVESLVLGAYRRSIGGVWGSRGPSKKRCLDSSAASSASSVSSGPDITSSKGLPYKDNNIKQA